MPFELSRPSPGHEQLISATRRAIMESRDLHYYRGIEGGTAECASDLFLSLGLAERAYYSHVTTEKYFTKL